MFEKHIKELNKQAMITAKKRLDNLSKPLNSLGWLEDVIIQICGILGTDHPDLSKKTITIMCADNGVVDEGVSQVGCEVTSIVANNFTKNITAVNHFSNYFNQEINIIDIGMKDTTDNQLIKNYKISNGTNNMVKGPAMTKKQALAAINVGIEQVKLLKKSGYSIVGTGEMGIGNTTTSTAILHVFLDENLEKITGYGAGLSKKGLERKILAIRKAIKINQPDKNDPLDVLAKVGGYDIAGMCGLFIGGAIYGLPIIIDGYISSIAALLAYKLCPACKDFMIPSHGSYEPGTKYVFEQLGLKPVLQMEMRLGEGTGASMIMGIIDLAYTTYCNMGTFEDSNVIPYKIHNEG
ncbi:MAG: nicotinate-nucleotide--dimethylbenzimidazole phosphoribosyltransferase [Clostridiales bacterium]|nr:nicotinate-nucleotide--dimethylbenzimidazole phosphoribosyltransferase [Clostridiales bacterium]